MNHSNLDMSEDLIRIPVVEKDTVKDQGPNSDNETNVLRLRAQFLKISP